MAGTLYEWVKDNADSVQALIGCVSNLLYKFQNWYDENAETLTEYVEAFVDFGIWSVAVDRLIKNQIIFTDYLSNEFAREIYETDDVDALISKYYFENNHQCLKAVISWCEGSELLRDYDDLFSQIIAAYYDKHYRLHVLVCMRLLTEA